MRAPVGRVRLRGGGRSAYRVAAMSAVLPAFFKLPHYRGEADPIHAVSRVVCLEKIDGANTRVLVPRGASREEELRIGGRTLMEDEAGFSQPFLGELFRRDAALCRRLFAFAGALGQDVALYGETCGGRIQAAGYMYGSRPHFLLFAARIGGVWLSPTRPSPPPPPGEDDDVEGQPGRALPPLTAVAEALELPLPPLLYEGPPDRERFAGLIERPSQHSLDQGAARGDVEGTQEGIVIWSDPLLFDAHGAPLVAKFKHPRRREALDGPPDARESAEEFARRVLLRERLAHAIEHLRETGKWTGEPDQDRPAVIRRLIQDVAREVPEYQEQLARHGKKAVRKALEDEAARLLAASDV